MKTVLTYHNPALVWIDGLPLGNGSSGMMMFGDAKHETFMLNHDHLWQHKQHKAFQTAKAIPALMELVKEQKSDEFNAVFQSTVVGDATACNAYQPFADLEVEVLSEKMASGYERRLDLENAVLTAEYYLGENWIRYTAFCDIRSAVMRVRITAGEPMNLRLRYTRQEDPDCRMMASFSHSCYLLDGTLAAGVRFRSTARIETDGTLSGGDCVEIKGMTSVELEIVLATSLMTEDLAEYCRSALQATEEFDVCIRRHSQTFSEMFNRCTFRLTHHDGRSTEELFHAGQGSGVPPVAWYEQAADMARYVLLSASQRGTLPCNLQGIWNHEVAPEWESGFTTDMNLQMYYWAANSARLYESQWALFDWITSHKDTMKQLAETIFGVKNGAYIPQYTDCFMEPTCWKDFGSFQVLWGGAASWLAQNFYEYWKYSGDDVFLKETAVPYMKSCAEFYMQLLTEGEDGRLHLYLSASPESFASDGAQVLDTAVMDIALIRELLGHLLEVDQYLHTNDPDALRWQMVLDHLVEYPVDESGTLLEWCDSRIPSDPGHRHLSHIYPLYPGKECYRDPALKKAALAALERRLAYNTGQSAMWSYAWYSCCFARIGDPVRQQACMQNLLIGATISNLLTVYSEFKDRRDVKRQLALGGRKIYQADGMMGYYAAVMESVLQCYDDRIVILPSLIDDWKAGGEVCGIAAHNGIVADVSWEDGALKSLVFYADKAVDITVESKTLPLDADISLNPDGSYTLILQAGEKRILRYPLHV